MELGVELALVLEAAREAGALAASRFGQPLQIRDKSPNNPVTDADLAVDALLKARLGAARPDYGWLSEETVDDGSRLTAAHCWVVDPIDGTRAFVRNKPHWTVCIGLMQAGEPVLGVVYNPITGELYHAMRGTGAFLNDKPIRASSTSDVKGCAMLGDTGMFAHPAWPVAWPPMVVEQRNSIAYRMCLVAAGTFDAAIALSAKHDWDLAAAAVIAAEAGALATAHDGTAFRFGQEQARQKSLVVAGSQLHGLLVERVRHVRLV
ncbi:MAG: 3'(2'),5'-bisphosphate nucleotidase CysQ [Hyphomonadaceae bacterium]|jgi:myo-inositol-1(or 4)-monophosphatase|nr:3'(2'),5'-bisphosphate nucleotidase CysQ [Hyphomonadaceae bacterium]